MLAHEVAHLAHRDSSLLTVTALMGGGELPALEVAVWLQSHPPMRERVLRLMRGPDRAPSHELRLRVG